MRWDEVRRHYPQQWLLVEAILAHSAEGKRVLDEIAVVESYPDAAQAMKGYTGLHRREPHREFYVLHTDRTDPDIGEISWLGIRQAS